MTTTWESQDAAMGMRDVIAAIADKRISTLRPETSYAVVQTINREQRSAQVLYMGDDNPVTVALGSIEPATVGQTVRIGGTLGHRYVEDVLGNAIMSGNDARYAETGHTHAGGGAISLAINDLSDVDTATNPPGPSTVLGWNDIGGFWYPRSIDLGTAYLPLTGGTVSGPTTFSSSVAIGTTLNVGAALTAQSFSGIGVALTALNATQLTSGLIPPARFPTTIGSNTTGYAEKWRVGRLFQISGDVVGSVTGVDGSSDVNIAVTLQPGSIDLTSDTTGAYVRHITGTANQIISTVPTEGEGTTPTLSLPQNIDVNAVPTFMRVNFGQATGTAPFTVASTTLVANLTSKYLGAVNQDDLYFRNAGNLNAGTVPSLRVSGAYTGITGLGTLTTLTVSGVAALGLNSTVAGSTIWHAGNDGAASTLDAGLLGGVYPAGYASTETMESLMGDLLSVGLYDAAAYNGDTFSLMFTRPVKTNITGLTVATGDHSFTIAMALDLPEIPQADIASGAARQRVFASSSAYLDIARYSDDDHLDRNVGWASSPKTDDMLVDHQVVIRARVRKADLNGAGIRQIARHGSEASSHLAATRVATTPDTVDTAIDGRVRISFRTDINAIVSANFPSPGAKFATASIPDREYLFYFNGTSCMFSTATTAGAQNDFEFAANVLGDHTLGVEVTPGGTTVNKIRDGVRSSVTIGTDTGLPNTTGAVTVGSAQLDGRLYWMQMEKVNRAQITLPGPSVAGNHLSTPGAPFDVLTGDFTMIWRIASSDWTKTSQSLVARRSATDGQNSVDVLLVGNAGRTPVLQLYLYGDGTIANRRIVTSTNFAVQTNNVSTWMALTYDADNGASGSTTRFWTSTDGVTWTKVGTDVVTAGVMSMKVGTSAAVNFGAIDSSNANFNFPGRMQRAIVRNGIGAAGVPGGTPVFDMSENDVALTDTTHFPASTGQVVTVNQTAGNLVVPQADSLVWRFDASERTGTGLTYADPRGRTWTLSNTTAVVPNTPDEAWTLYMDTGRLMLRASGNGSTTTTLVVLTAVELDVISNTADDSDFNIAATINLTGSLLEARGWGSPDGITWTPFGPVKSIAFAFTKFFDSPASLYIGGQDGTQAWDGRIYMAEMVAADSPNTTTTPTWRFDARDHVSGASFVDPYSRTWSVPFGGSMPHAYYQVEMYITTNTGSRSVSSGGFRYSSALGQAYHVRGVWNSSTDVVSAQYRAGENLDLLAATPAWTGASATFAGQIVQTIGAITIGTRNDVGSGENWAFGGRMHRIWLQKNAVTLLDLKKTDLRVFGQLTVTPTTGPVMTFSHNTMAATTMPVPQWAEGPTVYRHNMYWIVASSGEVDFVDSDYSGRPFDGDSPVYLYNGDWVIALDPLFGALGHEEGADLTISQVVFQYIPFSSETFVKTQISLHASDKLDPHAAAGYLKTSFANTLFPPLVHTHQGEIQALIDVHEAKSDPHPQYLTQGEADGLYIKPSDTRPYEPLGTVLAHEQKPDPHPVYVSHAEGNAAYAVVSHNHAEFAQAGHTHPTDYEVIATDGAQSARIFLGDDAPVNPRVGDLWIQTFDISLQPPLAPTGLTVSATAPTTVTITWTPWDPTVGQAGVQMDRSPNGSTGWVQIFSDVAFPYATSFQDTGLAERTTYWYRVRASNLTGQGTYGTISAATTNAPPTAPANLTVTAVTSTSFTLNWGAVAPPGTDPLHPTLPYEVFRNGTSLGGTASTSWNHTGLTENVTYNLGVRTRDSLDLYSTTTATTGTTGNAAPPQPTGLVLSGKTHNSITLSWTAVSGITDFNRYVTTIGGGHIANVYGATTYTFTGLTPSATYTFGVLSVDNAGAVSPTAEAAATTMLVNPDTTPPAGLSFVELRPHNAYGEMHIQWRQAETTARTDVHRYVNSGGWELIYSGALAANAAPAGIHSVYLQTYGPGTTIGSVIHQYDAAGNVTYGAVQTYTLEASPKIFSPHSSNTWRATNNGQWGATQNAKVYQGYFDTQSGNNNRGFWFYGTDFSDWWRAGRTVTGSSIYINREGCGNAMEDVITLWVHTVLENPGSKVNAGTPDIQGGSDITTINYNTAKWVAIPAGWMEQALGGMWRGYAIWRSNGKPYVCLRPAGDNNSGDVYVSHWG